MIAADDQQFLAWRRIPPCRIIVHATVAHVHAIDNGIPKRPAALDDSPTHERKSSYPSPDTPAAMARSWRSGTRAAICYSIRLSAQRLRLDVRGLTTCARPLPDRRDRSAPGGPPSIRLVLLMMPKNHNQTISILIIQDALIPPP